MATAVIPFNPRQNSLYMKSCYSVCKEMLNWFNEIQITRRRNKGVGTLDGQDFDTTLNKRTGNLCKLSGIVGQQGAWNYLHYTCNSLVGAEAIKLVVTKYFVKNVHTLTALMFAPYENLMYLHIHPLLVKGRVCSREMEPVCGEPYHARRVFCSDVSLGDLRWYLFRSLSFCTFIILQSLWRTQIYP